MPFDHDAGQAIVSEIDAIISRKRQRNIFEMFPDKGPFSFDKYPKHMEFFCAGKTYMERCFMAGNRVGKTITVGYELACHATNWYPWWWRGHRFRRPISAIIAGKTNKSTRDILQKKILGKATMIGKRKTVDASGLMPGEWIGQPSWGGVPDLVDIMPIRCLNGGWSQLKFRSYEQGVAAFEGSEEDVIALDEEPPMPIYGEALIRLTSTTGRYEDNGKMMLSFTPLLGYSEVVMQFIPEDMRPMPPPETNKDDYYEGMAA